MGGVNDYGTWDDSFNGIDHPMQYNLNGDGTTSAVQQQQQGQSPLGGLAAMLQHYMSPQSGVTTSPATGYGSMPASDDLGIVPDYANTGGGSTYGGGW